MQGRYETAYIGKWHQGRRSDPRPGFDHWLSFMGQGVYQDPAPQRKRPRVQGQAAT